MATEKKPNNSSPPRSGFTLVELLAVLAIIGILAAIFLPVASHVRTAALAAKTRTQLAQWSAAIEAFRNEYGFYPAFTFSTTGLIETAAHSEEFIQTLTGRKSDGAPINTATNSIDPGYRAGNTRALNFLTISEDQLKNGALADAFENNSFALLIDNDRNGLIQLGSGKDYAAQPSVKSAHTGETLTLVFPSGGIRASVAIWTAGAGRSADDIVRSW